MIFILTGPVHSGKTTLLKRAVHELKKQGIGVDGFLSEAIIEGQAIAGYNLFDIKSEITIPLIRKTGQRAWQRIGDYFFFPQGLTMAKDIILRSREADLGVVDEVGPLELSGKGFWPALLQVIFRPSVSFLLVVRESVIRDFLVLLGQSEVIVCDVKQERVLSRLIAEIKKAV